MGKIILKDPNNPEQPQEGVYEWRAKKAQKKICIYIGSTGKSKQRVFKKVL